MYSDTRASIYFYGTQSGRLWRQYFTPTLNMRIDALILHFMAYESSGNVAANVVVQITKNDLVLGEDTVQLKLSAGEATERRVSFQTPVVLSAHTQYCLTYISTTSAGLLLIGNVALQNLVVFNLTLGAFEYISASNVPTPMASQRLIFFGVGEILPAEAVFFSSFSMEAGGLRQVSFMRGFKVSFKVGAGLTRFFSGVRSWLAEASVWAGVGRRFSTVRLFVAELAVWGGFSSLFSMVRGFAARVSFLDRVEVFRPAKLRHIVFSATVSVQSVFSRSVCAARRLMIANMVWLSGGLSRMARCRRNFSVAAVSMCLASGFGWFRFSVLREAVYSVALPLKDAWSRSAVLSRALFTQKVWLSGGLNRITRCIRNLLTTVYCLASGFMQLRLPALRETVFSAAASIQAALSKQSMLTRQILSNLKVGVDLQRFLLCIRGFFVQIRLKGLAGFIGKMRYALKIFETKPPQPQPPPSSDENDNDAGADDDFEVDGAP